MTDQTQSYSQEEEILALFERIAKTSPEYSEEDGDMPEEVKPIVLQFAQELLASQVEQVRKLEAEVANWKNTSKSQSANYATLALSHSSTKLELTQANITIAALQARIEAADKQEPAG